MQCELTTAQIAQYTARQVENLFPDGYTVAENVLAPFMDEGLARVDFCFRHIRWAGYSDDGVSSRFNVLHSDQYCAYLYLLSNTVYKSSGDKRLASKLFYLNKALHAFNCMYDTELPEIFWLNHCIGTVLGKATYGNYFAVYHNCTVGAVSGNYPVIGEKVVMSAGSSVIGGCHIGDGAMIAPGCSVFKADVAPGSIASQPVDLAFHEAKRLAADKLFYTEGSSK